MTIREAQELAWKIADAKGFHKGVSGNVRTDTLLRLCLIHTEISEAAQEVKRHWLGDISGVTEAQCNTFAEELADTLIRIFDLAEEVGADLESAVIAKMEKNAGRPYLYGTALAAEGVKA